MNAKQALKEAVRRWGKTACVRDYGKHTVVGPEERREASEKMKALREQWPDKKLRPKEVANEMDKWFHRHCHYRFMVGCTEMGLFFLVKGQGDTWEEAFAAADTQFKKAA